MKRENLHFISTSYKDNYEPLIDIQIFFAETHSWSHLYWSEQGYLLLGPVHSPEESAYDPEVGTMERLSNYMDPK